MKHSEIAASILKPLAGTANQAYLSDRLQVADLLSWILAQTGPAHVQLTSFSISEEFLRRIFFIQKDGLIESLDIVLDFKATNKTLILWPFIAQVVQSCHLASNHSKILLVNNDRWCVSVVMSQNLTRGNRFESGFISTEPTVFLPLHEQVNNIINCLSIPFHEVFSRAINSN